MLLFVYGVNCLKGELAIEVDWQVALSVIISVAICGKLSGANLNSSITLSICLKRTNKFRGSLFPVYVAAQMVGAAVAFSLAGALNGKEAAPLVPPHHDFVSLARVVLSEIMGTFILIFLVMKLTEI